MKKTKNILFIISIISVFLIAGCGNSGSNDSSSGEKCTKQEAYTAQVPYNETEFYYVKEGFGRPFCEDSPYTDFTTTVTSIGKVCEITVKNNGNITGDWTLKAKFITTNAGGGPESELQTKEIKPGETVKFTFAYTQSDTPMSCQNACTRMSITGESCVVPKVQVCKYSFYQDVRKSRVITKFRTETKYRTVPC